MNERLQDDYIKDCERGLNRWNKCINSHGIDFKLVLPSKQLNRRVGRYADHNAYGVDLPTVEEREYVASLMHPVTDPGKFANYITPPTKGVHGNSINFEYVRFN